MTDQQSTDTNADLNEGMTHHEAGRLPEAEAAYRRVLEVEPNHLQANQYLGVLALQSGFPDAAVVLLERGDPDDAGMQVNLGRALESTERYDEAVRAYRRSIGLDPKAAATHVLLGDTLQKSGDAGAAEQCYRQAISLQPGYAEAYNGLGQVLEERYQFQAAVEAYERATVLFPKYTAAHNNLGNALHALGDYTRAAQAYGRAVDLEPGFAQAHCNLGNAMRAAGELDAAAAAFQQAVRRDTGFADAWYHLATTYLKLGNTSGALDAVKRCLGIEPTHQLALAFEAIVLNDMQDAEGVRRLYDFDRFLRAVRIETPPGYADLADFNRALAEQIIAHPSLVSDPFGASTRGGRHSGNLVGEPGALGMLEKQVRSALERYIETLPIDPEHSFIGAAPPRCGLAMQANILDSAGYLVPHVHPSGWVSGAYYVCLPDGVSKDDDDANRAGWIEFGRAPDGLQGTRAFDTRILRPEEGMVLLFPSYFYHGTVPFESTAPRISLGIDVVAE